MKNWEETAVEENPHQLPTPTPNNEKKGKNKSHLYFWQKKNLKNSDQPQWLTSQWLT